MFSDGYSKNVITFFPAIVRAMGFLKIGEALLIKQAANDQRYFLLTKSTQSLIFTF